MERAGHVDVVRGALALLLSLGLTSEANAGDLRPAYVLPTRVEYLPNELAATHVVLHGGFIAVTRPGNPGILGCGRMYFACQAGQEDLCRSQWRKIEQGIGGQYCQGFGEVNTLNTATFLSDSTPNSAPDKWNWSAGVFPDDYVQKYCPVLRGSACLSSRKDIGSVGDLGSAVPPMVDGQSEESKVVPPSCAIGTGRRNGIPGLLMILASVSWILSSRRRCFT